MTTSHEQQPASLNRAARRAKRKGKGNAGAELPEARKNDQVKNSQVMAQAKYKGRRGNR